MTSCTAAKPNHSRAEHDHHQGLRWSADREHQQRLPRAVPLNCGDDYRLGVRYYAFEVQWS